jgi:hypothetical protein
MSQKSSVLQSPRFVPWALTPDSLEANGLSFLVKRPEENNIAA